MNYCKTIFFILFVLFATINCISQIHPEHKRTYNWIFGCDSTGTKSIHVNFNTNPFTVSLVNAYPSIGNSQTCISDTAGNIMFTYNGFTLMDKNFNIFQESIYGDQQCIYCAIFLPVPEKDSLLLLIHSDLFLLQPYCGNLYYTLINTKGNNGLGSIITSNNLLWPVDSNAAGSITATYHRNGKDLWIVTGDRNSYLYSFLVDSTGIPQYKHSTQVTSCKTLFNQANNRLIPVFTPRPEGDLIAIGSSGVDQSTGYVLSYTLSIIKFNNETGEFSSELLLESHNGQYVAGDYQLGNLCFSPSGKWLYVTFGENILPRNGYIKRYTNLYEAQSAFDVYSEIVFESTIHNCPFAIFYTPDGNMFSYCALGDVNPLSGHTPYFSILLYPDSSECIFLYNAVYTGALTTWNTINNLPAQWYYRPAGYVHKQNIKHLPLLFAPNPANEKVYILNNHQTIKNVYLYDNLGKIYMVNFSPSGVINVSNIKNGFYILEVQYEDNIKRTRLIIEH